jgi:hypothetical protein
MFYRKRDIIDVESTITGDIYVFDIMKEETKTYNQWLTWKRFYKDYKIGKNDMLVFEFSVNPAYLIRLTACDDKDNNKAAPITRDELDLEESKSHCFLLISFFVCAN